MAEQPHDALAGMESMPDFTARTDLASGADPAESADTPPDEYLTDLGRVQEAVLVALRWVTFNDVEIREEQNGWIEYGTVPDVVAEVGYVGSSENAHRSSVSRAVRSLAEKKLVAGAVKEWHRFYGMETEAGEPNSLLSFGQNPWDSLVDDGRTDDGNARPRLAYVRLTSRGHAVARALCDE